ncbi:hypothetical protein Tco_0477894 [Tanacetum coccineum]
MVIQENVNTLQQTFKQRESQLLNDFSNLRKLKDKLEKKLHAQDQSIQTVHMMLKPKKLCEQYLEIAIGAQNPFYLRKAKVAQPTLYDGNEIINPDHDPTNVPSSEEDLELAELASVQKSLVTEVRAMKAVFENMEAKVDQNAVDKKCGEIERKNLLIANENLIVECLSKDVFYTATDFVLNVSRFTDMHDAFTIAQKRIADLESENLNLRNKIQNDDHDLMIKHFSRLEVEHFNLQLKYQNLKECFGNKKPVTSSDDPSFDLLDADPIFNLKALVSQKKDLTAKLNALHDLNERFRAKNAKIKQHYKELYDSIKITRAKTIEHITSLIASNDNFKAQLQEKGFAIAALKNELRKLTGNSVNTKFAELSILGKLVLQQHRNQSVIRQPNVFKSERPRILKPQFAFQVNVNNDLSKPVTIRYLPKEREYVVAKPHHMIAPGSSRWVPTGKIFTSSTTKVDSEPPNGSNEDITNPYECEKTLDVSAVQASVLNVNKWRLLTTLQAPFIKRKEKYTIQCALSSKEEKSSYNMANEHVPSPATTRSDDQILLFNPWVSIGKALTASADAPSSFTTTTKTTSTLPPPPPPL